MLKQMPTQQELVTFIEEKARAIIEGGVEHAPMLFVQGADGWFATVLANLTDEMKAGWQEVIPAILRRFQARGYIFITEAWMAEAKTDTALGRELANGQKQVSELPLDDRREILWLVAVEKGQPPRMMWAGIDNTPAGRRMRKLEPALSGADIGGRMVVRDW